jgi:hypothetical protein
MGIELPSELAGVAASAGVQWPQADEDKMRATASAWRQAGQSLTGVSADADSSAGKALAGVHGDTADAAKQHWNGFIEPDSGKLTATVQGCNSAADQLEHAADQVGEAKVQIVQHLVTLAKNNDAAQQAASAGNPHALLGLDTAVRGTAANVAQVNTNLTNSIRLDSGSTVHGRNSPVNANPGGGTFAGGSGLSGLEPLLGKANPVHTADSLGAGPLATVTGQGHEPGGHGGPGLLGGGQDAQGLLGGSQAGPGGQGLLGGGQGGPGLVGGHGGPGGQGLLGGHGGQDGPGLLGGGGQGGPAGPGLLGGGPGGLGVPGAAGVVQGGVAPGHGGEYAPSAGENTGPIQLPPVAAHGGGSLGTAPEAHTPPLGVVQQSAYVGPSVSPTMQPFAGAAPAAPIADPSAGASQGPVGFAPDAGMAAAPMQGSPVPGGPAPGGPAPGSYGGQAPNWGQTGAAPVGGGPVASGGPVVAGGPAGRSAAPAQYASGALVDQPGMASSHAMSRPSVRKSSGPRDPEVAIFLVHMFPIGHLPVASSRPARQLPLPDLETDLAAGSRFEPHDHPDSAIFDSVIASGDMSSLAEGTPAPDPLTVGYDPLGGGNETDWDRRFVVRPASEEEKAEYAWPPSQSFPEGGCDHGEAARLAPGTILDRFGTDEGRVFSVPDTSFAARSLPPEALIAGYHRYEVVLELPMWWALSTAWFGQPGGGVRYRAVYSAADLVALGFLQEITGDEE